MKTFAGRVVANFGDFADMNFIKLKEDLVKRYIANSPKTKDSVRPHIACYICSLAKIAYLILAVPQCLGHSLLR